MQRRECWPSVKQEPKFHIPCPQPHPKGWDWTRTQSWESFQKQRVQEDAVLKALQRKPAPPALPHPAPPTLNHYLPPQTLSGETDWSLASLPVDVPIKTLFFFSWKANVIVLASMHGHQAIAWEHLESPANEDEFCTVSVHTPSPAHTTPPTPRIMRHPPRWRAAFQGRNNWLARNRHVR